jgi:UDP-N-acetylmuramoyl-tripeptide--D-alanyl-D-alanine ligase
MKATLAELGKTVAARRIAVLGAMKELGDHGPAFHADLAVPLRDAEVDHVVLVGDEMLPLARELGKSATTALGKAMSFAHCQTAGEALAALAELGLRADDAVLIKGSNSVGLGAVVAALTQNKD